MADRIVLRLQPAAGDVFEVCADVGCRTGALLQKVGWDNPGVSPAFRNPLEYKRVARIERVLQYIRAEHELPNKIWIRALSEERVVNYLETMFDS